MAEAGWAVFSGRKIVRVGMSSGVVPWLCGAGPFQSGTTVLAAGVQVVMASKSNNEEKRNRINDDSNPHLKLRKEFSGHARQDAAGRWQSTHPRRHGRNRETWRSSRGSGETS